MATKPSILTSLAEQKSAQELQTMSRESALWLTKKVAELRNPGRLAIPITKEKTRFTRPSDRQKFLIGGMYFFVYDPKGKDTLPYYDRFPLVLALEKYPDGFLGLNLHYLPLNYRLAFLDKLMDYAVLNDKDDITRMRISYDILTASKSFREFKPCLKKYLYNHVQSKIIAVQPNEWEIAVHLPIQQFKKAPVSEVWQDSIKEMRK